MTRAYLLTLLIALAILSARRSLERTQPDLLLTALALIVAARLAAHVATTGIPGRLFSPSTIAVRTPFDLLSSPGDIALTGLAALALAATLSRSPAVRWLARHLVPALSAITLAIGSFLAYLSGAALLRLLRRMAANSVVDLADYSLTPFEAYRLAVLAGLLLVVLAQVVLFASLALRLLGTLRRRAGARQALLIGLLAWSIGGLIAEAWLRPPIADAPLALFLLLHALPLVSAAALVVERVPWRSTAVTGLAAGGLVYLATADATERERRGFLRDDLAPTLVRHSAVVRNVLDDVLSEASVTLASRIIGSTAEDAAYAVFRDSELARNRFRSAVDVQRPGGDTARFSFRLSLPVDLREVAPGQVLLQDVNFQGRRLRVLAGSRRLVDGTLVTVRVAEDHQSHPFFHDRAAVTDRDRPSPVGSRPRVDLTATDVSGAIVFSSASPPLPIDREVVDRALALDAPLWWKGFQEGRRFEALSFSASDRVLTLSMPLPSLSERVAGALHALLLTSLLMIGAIIGSALFSAPLRRSMPGPGWVRRSYFRKTLVGLAAGSLLPAVAAAAYLRATVDSQKIRDMRERGIAALEFARRILVELKSTEPEAHVDDGTLLWLSQNIGGDFTLFSGAGLEATSRRELVREGLVSLRPDARAVTAVRLDGAPLYVSTRPVGRAISFSATAPVGEDRLLTLNSVADVEDIERAAEERRRLIFLATAGLLAVAVPLVRLVARRATDPVRMLTAAVGRVARGDLDVRLDSPRQDEIRQLVDAFNEMAVELRTQRAELRARATYLSRLLENATIGVLSTDARGRLTTVNAAARSLLALDLFAGRPLQAAVEREDLEPVRRLLSRRPVPDREELEIQLGPAAGGRTLRAVLLALPDEEGRAGGQLLLLQDVSDIIKTKKLEAWAEMARRIAHEIKNPLTPIQLATEHLRRVYRDRRAELGEVLAGCTDTILRQVRDLRTIARDFSQYAAGPVALARRPTAMAPWLREVLAPYLLTPPEGLEAQLDLAEDLPTLPIDPARLQRALTNLIENALQAMPHGGSLRVSARAEAGGIVIEVADTGPGFPPGLLERAFEPYFSTRHGGTGLGLAIARKSVEEHGGTLDLRSEAGQGSTFVLRVPPGAGDRGP